MTHIVYLIPEINASINRQLVYSLISIQNHLNEDRISQVEIHLYTAKPLIFPEGAIFGRVQTHLLNPEEFSYALQCNNGSSAGFIYKTLTGHLGVTDHVVCLPTASCFTNVQVLNKEFGGFVFGGLPGEDVVLSLHENGQVVLDQWYQNLQEDIWRTSTKHKNNDVVAPSEMGFFSYSNDPAIMYLVGGYLNATFSGDKEVVYQEFEVDLDQAEVSDVLLKQILKRRLHALKDRAQQKGSDIPLISCLCLSENRPHLLERAVNCFKNQSYHNKELVVVYPENDLATHQFIEALNDAEILPVRISSNQQMTLGERRNLSVLAAKGDYVCQWDDDDWYHNNRIQWQYDMIERTGKPCSILMNKIIYNAKTQQAFYSFGRPWENTIMCHRATLIEQNLSYLPKNKQEDTFFCKELMKRKLLVPVDCPPSYIYVFHGANTWNHEHFQMLSQYSQPLGRFLTETIQDTLNQTISNHEASAKLSSKIVASEIDFFYSSEDTQYVKEELSEAEQTQSN